MWHLLSIILWFTCVQSYYQRPANNPYGSYNDRSAQATSANPQGYPAIPPNEYRRPSYPTGGSSQKPDYPMMSPYQSSGMGPNRPSYNYLYAPSGYYLRSKNLRESPSQKSDFYQTDIFDLDYGSLNDGADNGYTDPIPVIENKSPGETPSYYEELELTEKFGNYLKRRTRLDPSSGPINDAAHQYNALLAVIIALAKVIRNSCTEFEQIYDQIYLPTVETYYKYGLSNADKVGTMIEDYIRKGNSHMPKIRKLKEEICENELFCAASFDSHINNSPLVYVKELETLEALAHLARSFYPYIEDFNTAAQKGAVLQYLQKSKDKVKSYIMHVVNSVEHLTDKAVRCS